VSVMLCSPEEQGVYRKICRILKKEDGIPEFPVDRSVLSSIKTRINLARKIDEAEHRIQKSTHETNWFKKAAEEMDILLDDSLLGSASDSDGEGPQKKRRTDKSGGKKVYSKEEIARMRRELEGTLGKSLVPKGISGRYLTGNVGVVDVLVENEGSSTLMPTHRPTKAVEEVREAGKGKRTWVKK
ncbi:ATP-dependent RNA helicase, partial [Rhizophlyctis rosea]